MYSRSSSTTRVKCLACNWLGEEKDLAHTYRTTPGDVEPADYCPECGSDDLDFEDVRVDFDQD